MQNDHIIAELDEICSRLESVKEFIEALDAQTVGVAWVDDARNDINEALNRAAALRDR